MNSDLFKAALGRWTTGVTVITTRAADGTPAGFTANSFTSLSLNPPLVLFCLGKESSSQVAFLSAPGFAVHILADDQRTLAGRFAQPGGDKFAGLELSEGMRGVPLLPGGLACLECRTVQIHPGGDHHVVVGEVEAVRLGDGRPLIYHRGEYQGL